MMQLWFKRTGVLLVWILWSVLGYAGTGYVSYDYNDTHDVRTQLQKGMTIQNVTVEGRLHVRSLEHNRTKYLIFWLEGVTSQKEKIPLNSINLPFIVTNLEPDGFKMGRLRAPTIDRDVTDRLVGMVDLLQYLPGQRGTFMFKNASGRVKTEQTYRNGHYVLSRKVQYQGVKKREEQRYLSSRIRIIPENNSTFWKRVEAEEWLKMDVPVLHAVMEDHRFFHMIQREGGLPEDHWFMQLGYDVSTWGFGKKQKGISYQKALAMFSAKSDAMKKLIETEDSKAFARWVLENMDFLKHLSRMLENRKLDDAVSKRLFANLGYVDTPEGTDILAEVLLNTNIDHKERFRALMGLKNTSAPISDELLDDLITYGLESSDDLLDQASGMLLGTLARQRTGRVPEQFERIADAIADAVANERDKTVALNAAANMKESAPESVVENVEDVFLHDLSPSNRLRSARALLEMKQTKLEVSDFQQQFENETDTQVQAQVIKSSTVAQDFGNNTNYRTFLQSLATDHKDAKANRMAALYALDKQGFGRTKEEKQQIRRMMVGERDRDIALKLRTLYRK
jgi:uncharacterized protein YeaO (DUF488 family)